MKMTYKMRRTSNVKATLMMKTITKKQDNLKKEDCPTYKYYQSILTTFF